ATARARPAGARSPTPPPPAPRAEGPSAGAGAAVAWALGQLGKPYLWAADGPDSFDCSGLTLRAWAAAGVALPHSSRLQYAGQAKVALADLQAGDLVFYATDPADPATVHHVGMALGDGRMVEAPHTGAVVRRASIYRAGLLPLGTRPR
ncbi:NlpC/P60 family protein, partial [Kineococcus sp. R8]|uniref:C40 family peptidase n=1 Tax=Kineococcus siccus TaxID=2696567 RepID=UPI00141210A9